MSGFRAYAGREENDGSVINDNRVGGEAAGGKAAAGEAVSGERELSYREQILAHMEEMAKKVKDGTAVPSFQIGAQSFTLKEWEKLVADFDDAEAELAEQVKAMIREAEEQAEREALRRKLEAGTADSGEVTEVSVPEAAFRHQAEASAANSKEVTEASVPEAAQAGVAQAEGVSDVEETAALLTDPVTKCSYPTEDPKQKHWFITAYTQDGIWCKEAFFDGEQWVNRDCWKLSYTEKGQYEKVMAFLARFPQDANLRFAGSENFWQDFLSGKIDEDDFVSFFETSTKDGVPGCAYEKDGSLQLK